ncbi:hypothetical protein [Methylobacter sp. YRD-M1]|uniref:hypothetical protein n=1 Tax=Methylobacter sp. YRD-M1 TaxID=2911520 RepID=UPI00227B1839|nr:hypothetical protein [Methylobacter sp. YRD-M1]WAK02100.1 hypothetical protein LZ558_20170 [Methylobacter sp. YRD-M1]
MWTYYKQDYPRGEWVIFREDNYTNPQVYHRQKGWMPDAELLLELRRGIIDEHDIISEEEAFRLIGSLVSTQAQGGMA